MYGYHFVSEMLNTFEETFEDTEMRTFKHEPLCNVGGGGGAYSALGTIILLLYWLY